MDRRDPLVRPTATTAAVGPWVSELARSLGGLARSYLPGSPIDARTRQRVILAVTEVNGSGICAWVHGPWAEFVGDAEGAEVTDALVEYARASARSGAPVDPAPLRGVLGADGVAAVRATVAHIELANLWGNTAEALFARVAGRRPIQPLATAREVATVAVAVPLAVPFLAVGAVLRTANRLAPAMPPVELPTDEEPNLLAHLLAEAAPGFLSGSAMRTALLGLPFQVGIALRTGRTAATVEFGRGRLAISNGVRADAWVVVEGDVEPLLRSASGALVRELRSVRIRPT